MLSYEEIMNYCSNYRVKNGNVFDNNTNQQILDKDIILKVKSSILLFKEAKKSYQSDMQQFGKVSRSQELNELERQKQIAKQSNDKVAYNYAKSSIKKIIRESSLKVSPEQ